MKNPLLYLPPETAHTIALKAVKYGLAGTNKPAPNLSKTLMGLTFSSPIGLSAGADKEAYALNGWSKIGFGFVEAGTVTLYPRPGNPKPRIWRQPEDKSVINWMGLPGNGLGSFLSNLKAYRANPKNKDLIIGVSVASPEGNTEDLTHLAESCAPYADYFTLNASCPNVEGHDSNDALTEITTHIQAVTKGAGTKPVLLKLGPTGNKTALETTLKTALKAGATGFVLTNTVPPGQKDLLGPQPPEWPTHNSQPVGGYSGPRLLNTTEFMIKTARTLLGPDTPLVAVGGIQSPEDAQKLIKAGADLLQLYTGFIYQGPKLIKSINSALKQLNAQ